MASPLPPNPYTILGVPNDATAAAVKAAHRKLVLKCHPDKVSDPTAKAAASDVFHKIQSAYEILIDQDRRERYDAQVKLAELRKEKLQRQASGATRGHGRRPSSTVHKSSQESVPRSSYAPRESERPTPLYEERKPPYAHSYFDAPPRASTRKEPAPERTPTRSVPKPKPRTFTLVGKMAERERRKEKTTKSEREKPKDRDRKYTSHVEEEGSDSNSEDYERRSKMRAEDDASAARKAREAYYQQASTQQRDSKDGYYDERTRKMFAASADAWDYIRSTRGRPRPEPEQSRTAPVRQGSSSKDKFEYVKRNDGRPAVFARRSSERPKTARDTEPSRKPSTRQPERCVSTESADRFRKAPLGQSKSYPANIHIPMEKVRPQSVYPDHTAATEAPKLRRAETTPYEKSEGLYRGENLVPKNTTSRPTEFTEGLATPATTPDGTGPSGANSARYRHGRQYADDQEHITPDGYRMTDGYRTDVREPVGNARPNFTRKVTRSPSPVKDGRERPREKPRTSAARYPSPPQAQPPPNPRTTSYVYTASASADSKQQPNGSRSASSRDPLYYGEVRTLGDPPRSKYGAYSTADDNFRYQRPIRPEDIRVQSGYGHSKRGQTDRPTAC